MSCTLSLVETKLNLACHVSGCGTTLLAGGRLSPGNSWLTPIDVTQVDSK
jgi:hypothetical protein